MFGYTQRVSVSVKPRLHAIVKNDIPRVNEQIIIVAAGVFFNKALSYMRFSLSINLEIVQYPCCRQKICLVHIICMYKTIFLQNVMHVGVKFHGLVLEQC